MERRSFQALHLIHDLQGIGADEQVLKVFEAAHDVAGPHTDQALVGMYIYHRGGKTGPRYRVPRSMEGRVQGQHQTLDANLGDLHERFSRELLMARG